MRSRIANRPPSAILLATVADMEAAVPATLVHGQQFFADIELNQVDETGRGYGATVAEFTVALPEAQISPNSATVGAGA